MTENNQKIILIEDEAKLLDLFIFNLKEFFPVQGFRDGESFFREFKREETALVVTDVRLPGISGLEILARLKREAPEIPVVIITAYGSIDQAVAAIKRGAYDYLTKPVGIKDLQETLCRAMQFRESTSLPVLEPGDTGHFLTENRETKNQCALACRVASRKVPVLILGETGTGKELIAEMIHRKSGRKGVFVKINCAAIPAELLEGELFGYRKGAFTGAVESYKGKIRLASGGTLFLDEIGEMSEPLQVKLLRVLETESFYPLGDNTLQKVDLRVIAATNKDLKKETEAGRFRKDLYYRLAVIPIRIPALRDRREDIDLLARYYFKEALGGNPERVDRTVYTLLRNYSWPGNVRELKNMITHMTLLSQGDRIGIQDIPSEIMQGEENLLPLPGTYEDLKSIKRRVRKEIVAELEEEFLRDSFIKNQGNVTRTAAALKIDRRYLQNLLKKYNIRKGDS